MFSCSSSSSTSKPRNLISLFRHVPFLRSNPSCLTLLMKHVVSLQYSSTGEADFSHFLYLLIPNKYLVNSVSIHVNNVGPD